MAGEITEERDDNVTRETNSNNQLFASGGESRPVYGMGSRGYGKAGGQTRGRKAHVQFREQNSGFAPAEDYRAAKFLPGRWQDLDRNGCPVVLQGGDVIGLAAVESTTGEVGEYVHQVMPANGGIKQQLVYTGAMDNEQCVSLDGLFTTNAFTGGDTRLDIGTSATTTQYVAGNKPLAYNPTNVMSSGWEDVYTNQKFEGQVTMKTEWLCMYPVSDVFMHGATLNGGDALSIDSELGLGVEGARRSDFGFADVELETASADIVLKGIRAGDLVMPNPYMPGKLISVDDFVACAVGDTAGTTAGGSAGLNGLVKAAMGVATLTSADAYAYAMQHTVGRCFKRQPRATSDGVGMSNHDIYGSTYKYLLTIPSLGLSGGASQGIEADQEAGRQFAHALAPLVGGAATMDVVFINYEIR